MSNPNIIKPLVLTNSGHFKQMMVIILVLLAIIAALYRILNYTRPFLFYYSLFGGIFALLVFCLLYLFAPSKSIPLFRIDENGMYFHYSYENRSHSFKWSELKQITAQWCYNEKGFKERGVRIVTQEDGVYEFCVFKYFAFGWMETPRLKKAVDYFSKGSVPFKTVKLSLFYMNK